MTTEPTTDEQKFLATLQECLQADNDKRTAAEVWFEASSERLLWFPFVSGYLSRDTGWTKNRSLNVNIAQCSVRYTGKD